ncbi:MAG: hypothetical protein H6R00_363 [Proteobacteria bacterium]|nr:hypothetical protein [Pseudomonadota bacterium]
MGVVMVIRKRGILALIGICALAVIVKLFWLPTAEIHYRLTAYFETSRGETIAASGVWAVYYSTSFSFLPDVPDIQTKSSGDAIRIDTGEGSALWMVLSSGVNCPWKKRGGNTFTNGPAGIVNRSFGIKPAWSRQRQIFSLPIPGATSEIDVCDLPQIVTFVDERSPSTVRPVLFDENKYAVCCNVIFKRANIEILKNSEMVTRSAVRNTFPWVPKTTPENITSTVYLPDVQQVGYPEFSLTDTSLSIRGF